MDLVSSVFPQYFQARLTNPRFVIANLLALASVCPFVGSLSDLIGRRYVALIVRPELQQSPISSC